MPASMQQDFEAIVLTLAVLMRFAAQPGAAAPLGTPLWLASLLAIATPALLLLSPRTARW